MKNREMFANYMTMLGEMFDKDVSKTLMEGYWQALEPYDDDQAEAAFKRLIVTVKFFPRPAEVLEAITGPQQDQAVLAWQKVNQAVKDHGPYASVKFDDPAIHSAIELMGGWVQLQDCHIDEWKWKQKEFERLYPIMTRRGNHPEQLPGICETDNVGRGYTKHIPEPVRIGDGERNLRLVEKTKKEVRDERSND